MAATAAVGDVTATQGKKLRRKGGMHASTSVSGAVGFLIVAGVGVPDGVDIAAVTAAVTTIVNHILNEAADPK